MLSRQIEKVCGWAQMELSGGVRTFYEEDEAVFVPQLWDAHVLRKKGDSLEKTGQKYYEIKKFGDFYVGIQIKTEKSASGGEQKVDGSETYFLLDKQGNQIKQISSKEFYSLYNEMDQAQNSLEEVSEEKMDLNIEFVDSYTKTVKKITTPEGKVIFDPSDDFRYDLQSESQPEKGLFLLQGVSNDGTDVEKSCFINASEDVSLTFDTPFVFMKGKLIEHYFSKNDADLYNTSGEKL